MYAYTYERNENRNILMPEIIDLSAVELSQLIKTGQISCVEVLESFIARHELVNSSVNAIVTTVFDQAMDQAKSHDSNPNKEGKLFGLPIAHKDLARTKNIRTTFGSVLFYSHVPDQDDLFVERIRDAGAICIGKTNTPEFGAGSHTFNRVFGSTCNPYDTSRSCGGSSGGAAVALATKMLPIADGGDFGGSLRNPAAFCNVVGFRPSPGRVPNSRFGNLGSDLPTLGPMARSIDDVALLFSVMAGPENGAYGLLDTPGADFEHVEAAELADLRIAYTPDFGFLPVEQEIEESLNRFADNIEKHGGNLTLATPDLSGAVETFQTLRALEFRNRFGAFSPEEKLELKETIIWNTAKGFDLTLEEVLNARSHRAMLIQRVSEFFQDYDLLIGPSTQVLPFPIETEWVKEIRGVEMESYIDWMSACTCISVVSTPALSLPAGFSGGLPVGAQLIAPIGQDKKLLSMSKAIEQITAVKEPSIESS